jgi:hypothetical protein
MAEGSLDVEYQKPGIVLLGFSEVWTPVCSFNFFFLEIKQIGQRIFRRVAILINSSAQIAKLSEFPHKLMTMISVRICEY